MRIVIEIGIIQYNNLIILPHVMQAMVILPQLPSRPVVTNEKRTNLMMFASQGIQGIQGIRHLRHPHISYSLHTIHKLQKNEWLPEPNEKPEIGPKCNRIPRYAKQCKMAKWHVEIM
jgi:hypothetical protein